MTGRRPSLNFSRTAEADADFAGFDDDRYLPSSIGELEHLFESLLVFEHINVLVWNFAPRESLPGSSCVGSKVLTKNNDFFWHMSGHRVGKK